MLATKNVRAQILEAKQCVETKLYSPNLCLGKSIVVVVWFVCQVLHVVVRNPPSISLDTVTVMEDDWNCSPHKMNEFYTAQLQRTVTFSTHVDLQ